MIKVRLNEEQKKALITLRNTRSTLGERAHYVLLSDEGSDVKPLLNNSIVMNIRFVVGPSLMQKMESMD